MNVCIVGGGLAGLASAISLANAMNCDDDDGTSNSKKKMTTITVVEKRDFSSRGATFGLALNGQAALREFCPDLLQELQEIGIELPTGGYMLPWYRVRDGLLERARTYCRGVTILENTSVVSAVEQDQGVIVTLEGSVTNFSKECTRKELIVDLLIGADGVNSSIRQILGAPPALPSGTRCWRGALNSLPSDLSHVLDLPVATMIKTESGFFSIFNFNLSLEGFISWVATSKNLDARTPLEMIDGIENKEEEKMVRRLLEESTQDELEFSTILSTIPMEGEGGWGGKGRITLIGDSAHALRPASGLGGGLALEDAVMLTRAILAHQKAGNDVNSALRDFESVRFVRCKTIVDDQTWIAEAGYGKKSKTWKWTPEYEKWVFTGPDANPNPPDSMYVDDTREDVAKRKAHTKATIPAVSSLLFLIGLLC